MKLSDIPPGHLDHLVFNLEALSLITNEQWTLLRLATRGESTRTRQLELVRMARKWRRIFKHEAAK